MTKLIGSQEVASRLGVNIRTARKLMYQMHYVNLTGSKEKPHIKVSTDELERFIQARTKGVTNVVPMSNHIIKRRKEG